MQTVTMTKTKETKGTWVYSADKEDAVVPTLYIKKAGVAALGNPEEIVLTVAVKD